MNDVIVQKNGENGKKNGKNGHHHHTQHQQQQQQQQQSSNLPYTIDSEKLADDSEPPQLTIWTVLIGVLKVIGLFCWYLILSCIQIFHKKKKSIRHETVLVTGAAGYLGRQLATEFAKHGATVICWDFNQVENKKTYDHIRSLGYKRVHAYKVDLTDEKDVRENSSKIKEKHGFVSMIVLAAATPCEIESIFSLRDNDKLTKSFKLFYESHLWMYQEFLPKMIEKNHGHIAVVSSETVFTKLAFIQTYSAMKSAQAKLFECVDAELNYTPDNKIKTTLVYLGGLKKGISTTMVNKFMGENPLGPKAIDKFGLSNEYAAKRIVKSILKNEKYVYMPLYVYILVIIKFFLPTACCELILSSRFISNRKLLVFKRENLKTPPAPTTTKKID